MKNIKRSVKIKCACFQFQQGGHTGMMWKIYCSTGRYVENSLSSLSKTRRTADWKYAKLIRGERPRRRTIASHKFILNNIPRQLFCTYDTTVYTVNVSHFSMLVFAKLFLFRINVKKWEHKWLWMDGMEAVFVQKSYHKKKQKLPCNHMQLITRERWKGSERRMQRRNRTWGWEEREQEAE